MIFSVEWGRSLSWGLACVVPLHSLKTAPTIVKRRRKPCVLAPPPANLASLMVNKLLRKGKVILHLKTGQHVAVVKSCGTPVCLQGPIVATVGSDELWAPMVKFSAGEFSYLDSVSVDGTTKRIKGSAESPTTRCARAHECGRLAGCVTARPSPRAPDMHWRMGNACSRATCCRFAKRTCSRRSTILSSSSPRAAQSTSRDRRCAP